MGEHHHHNSRAGHQAHTHEGEGYKDQKIKTPAESAKQVTLLDTPGVKVQAEVDIMAVASRSESIMQKSGTNSSLREALTWKLTFAIHAEENKWRDNLVEMVSATKDTRSAAEEVQVMITDLGRGEDPDQEFDQADGCPIL